MSLGRTLFFDPLLSLNNNQSCATCHSPQRAFTDARSTEPFSVGSDGHSLTTRNTPSLDYVAQTPNFGRNREGAYHGGFFYDGRSPNLAAQAKEPIFSPIEMALPDVATLQQRITDHPSYPQLIGEMFGPDVLTDADELLQAVTQSLAAFQTYGEEFSSFSSRYDKFLRGELQLTQLENRGRLLFFSSLVNCSNCHHLEIDRQEPFTDYTFHNIGVPGQTTPDLGLAANPSVQGNEHQGKFKVPSLRNVAVTPPYMHNGSMQELETVLIFYNTYLINTPTNPETGRPWGEADVDANISTDLLSQGQPLSQLHIDALIAFMRALTDERYAHLLDDS